MMSRIRQKPLPRLLASVLGAGVAISVAAPSAYAQQAQKVEKIEVTGSNIKRVDTETVAPVEVISREQIERSGQPTIADLLKNIPANTGGSYSESFANSFAPGASGLSLRGLGQKNTLVLINGRRTSGYGFAQNLQDTFVDLNSIPSSAVERIEILKDGASAIYGSDAIAGVINVILRKDYKGVDVGGGVGSFEGKNDYRFNLTAGAGDLAKDKWNIVGTLDYYKRESLLLSDTEFGKTRDYRGEAGGRNFQSFLQGVWIGRTATGAATGEVRAMSECAGRVINNVEANELGLMQAQSAANRAVFDRPGNTFCLLDINPFLQAVPQTERIGFLGRATRQFSADVTGYAELGLSRVDSKQDFTQPLMFTTGLSQTAVGLRPFTFNTFFAPGSAGNPLSTNATFSGNLNNLGPRKNEITSDTMRFLGGLTYQVMGWDLDSAVGLSKNEVDNYNINRTTLSGAGTLLGVPTTPQPPTPTSTNSRYNLDRPSTNSAEVNNTLLYSFYRKAESELSFVDTKGSTEIGRLPGGPVGLALGAEFRSEKLADRPDSRAIAGDILGQGITATDAKRRTFAAYAEASLPITKAIEGQAALRFDRYSDYGNSTTPKLGVKYRADPTLLFRANWGKGFRAPTLPEISPSVATFFIQVVDPVTGTIPQVSGVYAGNPDLKAEKSASTTAGFVWEPARNFSVGATYWNIKWENLVTSDSFQTLVNNRDPRVIRDPLTGNIVTILNNYFNAGLVRTRGVDIDGQYAFNTAMGKFTTRLNWTYTDSYKIDGDEYAGRNGNVTMPRNRGNLTQDWDYQAWGITGRVNFIGHYYQDFLSASYFTPQADTRFQTGTYPTRVGSFTTLDLFGRYQLRKNLSVSLAVLNATDERPPYDPGASGTYIYDFTMYSVIGRQYRLGFKYTM